MNGYVLQFIDSEMKVSRLCDDYISLRFTEEFSSEGEFECVLRAGSCVPDIDSFVMCSGLLYVVERVTPDTSRAQICVRGRGILSFLGRKSIPYSLALRRSAESSVKYLVQYFANNVLPLPLSVGEIGAVTDTHMVVEAGNLLARLKLLASSVMKGLRLTYSTMQNKFIFELYERKNRRLADSDAEDPILLCEQLGTLGTLSAVTDKTGYLNRVRVRGSAGKAGVYNVVTVNASSYSFPDGYDDSGEQLREGFARSGISVSLYTTENADGEDVFDSAGYYAALYEYGRQYLSNHRVRREITAHLPDAGSVSVGDVCSIRTTAMDTAAVLIRSKEYSVKNGELSCIASMTAIG